MKTIVAIIFALVMVLLLGFGAGFVTHRSIVNYEESQRDTIIFKSMRTDSVRLFVVLKDGKLQSFWYHKIKRWKIKPTIFK